ncbi:hypothetical protein Cgig2_020107 [Carnegiea gigantea]|uniref:Uncharacterized protein n=1 Tax=Carnegiea gigantea TaxID=171969 RepID=A0A9Q1KFR5_9CARY|nr:hypothetical protein Cgig2_020107 [Carnegiea gigantea]
MSGDERERMSGEQERKLHVAMYPWFALGHLTPFLHLANKLAQRGHTARPKLAHLNFHPTPISFITVPVPAVDGLPIGAQTTTNTTVGTGLLLFDVFDLTWFIIDSSLSQLKPDFVFFDYAHWLPSLARKYGARPIYFSTTYISFYAYMARLPCGLRPGTLSPEAELMSPPPGFPSWAFWL